jgi:hypothetical protein
MVQQQYRISPPAAAATSADADAHPLVVLLTFGYDRMPSEREARWLVWSVELAGPAQGE